MNKLILIILTLFISLAALSVFSPPIYAATGFSLGPGTYTGKDNLDQPLIYPRVNINVDVNGNLSAKARDTVTVKIDKYEEIRIVTIDITVTGNFDKATGAFTGKFSFTDAFDRQ